MPQTNEFLQQVLDLMNRRMDDLSKKIDDNTRVTTQTREVVQHIGDKVDDHDRAIKALEAQRGKKLELSPSVVYLVALAAVILLVIIASVLRIDLKGLLG